jgi:magnesium-transporting ATPase (P-type)
LKTILRLVVEFLLIVLAATFLIYETDPDYENHSSSTRQTFEITSMFCVIIIALIQSLLMFFTWVQKFDELKK